MSTRLKADIIVVGAGAVGAATAYFLARSGVSRVLLLDREGPAAGASGRTGALVRMHYTNPFDARLALKSLEMFEQWSEVVGGQCGFRKTGFMCLVDASEVAGLRVNTEMLRGVGVNTWVISPEEAVRLQPFLSSEALGGAAYEPDSGYADGWSTTNSLVDAGRDLGVRALLNTSVTRLVAEGGRIRGVETVQGTIESDAVVLAAGAWSGHLARTAGVDLALEPRRIAAAILQRPAEVPEHMVYIDMSLGFYLRLDSPGLSLVGVVNTVPASGVDPDDDDQRIAADRVTETLRRLCVRIPGMERAGWRRDWVGVDGHTPDGHMLLGPAPGVEGLFVATGGSGTGFKTAPAVGLAVAELVTEGRTSVVDLHPFRLTRFAEGEPIEDEYKYKVAWPI